VKGPPSSSPAPAPPAAPTPAPAAPSPSPGGRVASTDNRSIAGSVRSPSAPSGLMASVAEDDFDSDEEFCWAGDESGLNYSPSVSSASRKSNARVAPYCCVITFQLSLLLIQWLLLGSSNRWLLSLAVLCQWHVRILLPLFQRPFSLSSPGYMIL